MSFPGLATGLNSVTLASGTAGASGRIAVARATTFPRSAINRSCVGNGYRYEGSTSSAAVISLTVSSSTTPRRSLSNRQRRMAIEYYQSQIRRRVRQATVFCI